MYYKKTALLILPVLSSCTIKFIKTMIVQLLENKMQSKVIIMVRMHVAVYPPLVLYGLDSQLNLMSNEHTIRCLPTPDSAKRV